MADFWASLLPTAFPTLTFVGGLVANGIAGTVRAHRERASEDRHEATAKALRQRQSGNQQAENINRLSMTLLGDFDKQRLAGEGQCYVVDPSFYPQIGACIKLVPDPGVRVAMGDAVTQLMGASIVTSYGMVDESGVAIQRQAVDGLMQFASSYINEEDLDKEAATSFAGAAKMTRETWDEDDDNRKA